MHRPSYAIVFAIPLALAAAGCTPASGWTPMPPPPRTFAHDHPEQARVTLRDGSVLLIAGPTLAGDTLFGSSEVSGRRSRVGIPVGSVRTIERWRVRRVDSANDLGGGMPGDGMVVMSALAVFAAIVLANLWHSWAALQ